MGTLRFACLLLSHRRRQAKAPRAVPIGTITSYRECNMDYRRAKIPGAQYFFTVVIEHRRHLLIEHMDRLRAAFRHVQPRHPFRIDAIVILPDHLHTLWTLPTDDSDYANRWMRIKRTFSSGFPALPSNSSQKRKREKGIWQRRFWEHCIRDERDRQNHLDYIHYNPVKHGYVEQVRDWPYSTFQRLVKRGWYTADWGQSISHVVHDMDCE
uniref:Putative transposase n=1 Tax=Candidatus Kentrum sp. TUN TaxID=2126343 RepID=A0A450ZRI1_9GAMM|nr:MAG: putative transposase [Candidatus Kentron sp. TUN]